MVCGEWKKIKVLGLFILFIYLFIYLVAVLDVCMHWVFLEIFLGVYYCSIAFKKLVCEKFINPYYYTNSELNLKQIIFHSEERLRNQNAQKAKLIMKGVTPSVMDPHDQKLFKLLSLFLSVLQNLPGKLFISQAITKT